MKKTPHPFVKYPGGKSKLADRIISMMPDQIRTYYEPMVGGGAVFFELAKLKRFEKAVITDMNSELINCYQVIQSLVEPLIDELNNGRYVYDKTRYLEIRAIKTKDLNLVEGAARFIYLNRTCFL